MFNLRSLDRTIIGQSEDSKYEFFEKLVLLKDIELRLTCYIGHIKLLDQDLLEEAANDRDKFLEKFPTLPYAAVGTILMFNTRGVTINTGHWVLRPEISRSIQKLVFGMVTHDSKTILIAVDPLKIQKAMVRAIPINPFPDSNQNRSDYGIIEQRLLRGSDGSLIITGNAWKQKTILRNHLGQYLPETDEEGEDNVS